MGLPDRGTRMPPYSLWTPVRLPQARKRLAQAAWLPRVRKLAAGPGSAVDDLWRRRSEAAEPGRPTITRLTKWWLRKRSIALNPPLEDQRFYASPAPGPPQFRAGAIGSTKARAWVGCWAASCGCDRGARLPIYRTASSSGSRTHIPGGLLVFQFQN